MRRGVENNPGELDTITGDDILTNYQQIIGNIKEMLPIFSSGVMSKYTMDGLVYRLIISTLK